MSPDLLGPLIESCFVGGLTAILLAYEHANAIKLENSLTDFPEDDLTNILDEEKIEELKKGVKKEIEGNFEEAEEKEYDPFIIPAAIFFFNEIVLFFGYFLKISDGKLTLSHLLDTFLFFPLSDFINNYTTIPFPNLSIDLNFLGEGVINLAYCIFLIAIILLIMRFEDINYILKVIKLK